jgi:Zn-finger nucleic acid-binding protein
MTCQNCGAPVRLDSERGLLVCDYCGSECTPPADEDGVQVTGETACPCAVCHTPLSTGRIEALDVLYCTACHGILVSMDDFGLLLEHLREHRSRAAALLTPHAGADSVQDLRCPLCTGAMNHRAYGGGDLGKVMIDSCEACFQVWLHRGTLGRIILTLPDPEPVDPTAGYPADLTALAGRMPVEVQLVAAALNRLLTRTR